MIFKPREMTCKDGRTCILRSAEPADAADLIRYLKITSGETPYLMRNPEEINLTVEQQETFLAAKIEAPRELMLVATVDGRHVGNCSLMTLGPYQRYEHRCGVAIALYQEYCGLGIGRRMLEIILEKAKECGYEQVELEVVSTNVPAIHLYESLGLETYATQYHSMKYPDGTYADEYLMMKKL